MPDIVIELPSECPRRTMQNLIAELNRTGMSYRPKWVKDNGRVRLSISVFDGYDENGKIFSDKRIESFIAVLNKNHLFFEVLERR